MVGRDGIFRDHNCARCRDGERSVRSRRCAYAVVSLDYIKADRRRDTFARASPKLVVVDEAHAWHLMTRCADIHHLGSRSAAWYRVSRAVRTREVQLIAERQVACNGGRTNASCSGASGHPPIGCQLVPGLPNAGSATTVAPSISQIATVPSVFCHRMPDFPSP
jgi:hypothetical protein